MTTDNATILNSIRKGDPMRQLDMLYKNEFPKIKSYILKNSGQADDAMDVFQETVMVLFSHVKLGKFKEEYDIGGFMYVVARNIWRKRNKNPKNMPLEDNKDVLGLGEDPYKEIFNKEREDLVKGLFIKLGENCKAILSSVLYDGLSMKEIAVKYGYASETTAKTRHYKCKQRLIKLVKANRTIEQDIRF